MTNDPDQKMINVIYDAILNAIQSMGIDEFKKTSFFGRCQRIQEKIE